MCADSTPAFVSGPFGVIGLGPTDHANGACSVALLVRVALTRCRKQAFAR